MVKEMTQTEQIEMIVDIIENQEQRLSAIEDFLDKLTEEELLEEEDTEDETDPEDANLKQ